MGSKSHHNGIKIEFKGKDIIDCSQFSREDIEIIFKKTDRIRKTVIAKGGLNTLRRKIMAPLFFEPSTRTFASFASGMERLGGSVIPLPNMQTTSVAKGESFEDTIKVFSSYADILVIRHPETGIVKHAADIASIPVINAGDGIGEHPTQALYDLYTIKDELGQTDGLRVVFFGELGRYRPVNSLAKLLSLFPQTEIAFVSPSQGRLQAATRDYLKERNVRFSESATLTNIIEKADVLYVTRIKKEFMSAKIYNKMHGKYNVDNKLLMKMKKKSIVMHALPRLDEIEKEVDEDSRAVYLDSQIKNGMYLRMALLSLILA
ncbi:aspartate carbamoyltransferase [Patescibacteria group bacterium]|nr:aspartate carbamoyltransferase [Patescibacteria group bacterium]MCL5010310.1 aspartate carbamoyltransferase [Patescibacteria group bacterium]